MTCLADKKYFQQKIQKNQSRFQKKIINFAISLMNLIENL